MKSKDFSSCNKTHNFHGSHQRVVRVFCGYVCNVSNEYQTLERSGKHTNITRNSQVNTWTPLPVFTDIPTSANLTHPTPRKMYQSSPTFTKDKETRTSTGSNKKIFPPITPKSDVGRVVSATPRRSTRKVRHQDSKADAHTRQYFYDCDRSLYTGTSNTGKDGNWEPTKLWRNT